MACFVCEASDAITTLYGQGLSFRVDCPVCGRYVIQHVVTTYVGAAEYTQTRRALSYRLRQASDRGELVTVSSANFESLGAPVFVPVSRKSFHFVELVAGRSAYPGEWI